MKSFCLALCAALIAAAASAQATRTWVSGDGDDVNPCSRTAPCKTFAGAISKTAAGGEINALDPGGYGAVTITKSITIDGTGTEASILASLSNGINVTAATTDKVILRNLAINGAGGGVDGIKINSAKSVRIENVTVFGFNNRGINIQQNSANPLHVTVVNSTVKNSGGIGIVAQGSALNMISLNIIGSTVEGSTSHGLWVSNGNNATISRSNFLGNGIAGLITTGNGTRANVHSSTFANNATGIQAGNGASESTVITLSASQVSANSTGVSVSGGSVESHLDNALRGNTAVNVSGTILSAGNQ